MSNVPGASWPQSGNLTQVLVSNESRCCISDKEYSAAGDIKFHDAELEIAFWEKTRDERFSDVTLSPENVAQHFKVPPWEMWIAEQARKATEINDPPKLESK